MIDQRDTSWDDTGFDDDDSFRRASQQSKPALTSSEPTSDVEPEVAASSTSADSETQAASATSPLRRQAIVIPPPPPFRTSDVETAKDVRRRRLSTILITLALLTIIIAGGYIISTLFLPDETETALFVDTQDSREDTTHRQVTPPPSNNDTSQPTLEVPQQPAPVDKPKQQQTAATQEPREATSKNAEWVVQVFSSPSRDDAAEWLQTLQRKSVSDGYIVEHDVRGTTWYRVRFGQFATREEAETAAMEAGVQQPWIARIR
ncbi:MAG TPA: hypothetical protein DIS79_07545 [Bacteroidetes bacterium]|nr:hypothetical protein [Bacteroidota bacterium]HRK03963.1 SPOR domain-containing protein [Chlorobiota bacterium]